MVEVERVNFKAKEEIEAFRGLLQSSPEYKTMNQDLAAYQLLFRLMYVEGKTDIYDINKDLKLVSVGQAQAMRRVLESYLKLVYGGRFNVKAVSEQVCGECFLPGVVDTAKVDGDEVKRACGFCGFEAKDVFAGIDEFSTDIPFDQTFAPVSLINDTDGPGGTFHPNNTREVRDHKNFLFDVVNANNITWADFKKSHPQLAEQMVELSSENGCSNSVLFEDFVFIRVGAYVRKIPKAEYEKFCHQYDPLLRRSILIKQSNSKGVCSKEKIYGMSLCKKYGFGDNNNDQALINTLGLEIDKYKPFVDRRDKHVNYHVYVNTLFVKLLAVFDRSGKASQAKSELKTDKKLLGFIDRVNGLFEADAAVDDEECGALLLSALMKHNDGEKAAMLPPTA